MTIMDEIGEQGKRERRWKKEKTGGTEIQDSQEPWWDHLVGSFIH